MSKKYVIDIPNDAQYILINGASENHCYTRVEQVDDLEELNSDYINENFGELQDEAYQKGFEDGKNSFNKGCDGCKYESRTAMEEPCKYCSNCHTSKYTPMPKHSGRIEVGDIVNVYGKIGVVTYAYNDTFNVMMYDGSTGRWRREDLKKDRQALRHSINFGGNADT